MAIDLKYGRVTTERGSIGDDEPVVVFRAQDALLPTVLHYYGDLCLASGASTEHLNDVLRADLAVHRWQRDHDTKVPDPITGTVTTEVPF